jgi:hypothetical protein
MFLRHIVATLAYRGGKAIRGAPEQFAEFRAGSTSRAPVQIVSHIGDLLDWALSIAEGKQQWRDSKSLSWNEEIARFSASLEALDGFLASEKPLVCEAEKLFQGPLADALTHVGQLAMLRRLAGAPVKGENYYAAKISSGNVGPDQPSPVREFD